MKKNWLTLNTDTFLWLKGDLGLVYNATNKRRIFFALTDGIEAICHKLLITENLYTIELTDDSINDKGVNKWVQSLIDIDAGYLTYNVTYETRPISLKPILKVQDKKEYYEFKHSQGFRGEILQNIHEITFYINGSVYGNNAYFKQHVFPLKDCLVLDSSKIQSFINNSINPVISNINLVGNLFSYSGFEIMVESISNLSIPCTIHIMIQDFLDNIRKIKEINWPNQTQFNVLVDTAFDVSCIQGITIPFSITAFVFSEKDFHNFSTMFEVFPAGQSVRFIPLYNKKNLPFFESNIFIEKDELDTIELSKNEIFMRQALNSRDFGKLTIMPDEKVYANVNTPFLGTINDSPYSIVYKEFMNGQSWLKVRNQSPCNDCIYQWLCPSPSNYETIIGRSNLCHINRV